MQVFLSQRHWVCTGTFFISLYDTEGVCKIIPNVAQALIFLNLVVFQVNTEGRHHLFTVRALLFQILKLIQHF